MKSFGRNNELLKLKIWTYRLTRASQNVKHYIDSHSKFVIGIQYMIYYEMINSNEEYFF